MESKEFSYVDSINNPQVVEISDKQFEFVQKDRSIKEQKFKGKPTTFFKDAMKRFVKNKSSVVGGCILGFIILCAIFVPLFTQDFGCYDVSTTHLLTNGLTTTEVKLPPKLFPSGTGFWDGTIQKSNVPYDQENEYPVGYSNLNAVSNLKTKEYYLDQEGTYGSGGYINLTYKNESTSKIGDMYTYVSYDFDFDSYSYKFNYTFLEPSDESYISAKYRISLITLDSGVKTYYPLTGSDLLYSPFSEENENYTGFISEYSLDDSSIEIDVSSIMKDKYSLSILENAYINIDILKTDSEKKDSIYIKSLLIDTDDPSKDEEDGILDREIKTGNSCMIQEQKVSDGSSIDLKANPKYWRVKNGSRSCLNVKYVDCSFKFDAYESVYGDIIMTIGATKISSWINSGYFTYNPEGGETSDVEELNSRYESLSKKNPIVELISQNGNATFSASTKEYMGYTLTVKISQWKYRGYSSMPIYIFGTDANGRDFLKTITTALRTSLLLAVGVALVNIVIGIIWGAISGYFGGWTDIIMERVCDIVSGLPSIAIITLCLLHLNNDMLAFLISMFMTGWMGVAGRTRTQFYRYKRSEYVLASRTLGASDFRLIFRHILPNSMGTIITSSILMIPSVIYSEASIAYLGLGLKSELLFGVILSENRTFFEGYTMYLLVIPTVIMAFLLVSFNLFGNGLRDAFNPSLKGSE